MGVTYDVLAVKKNQLIRKALNGSVFIAPIAAPVITKLTDPTDKLLVALPSEYEDLGWAGDDGSQFGRDVDTSNVSAYGSPEPVRSDVKSDVSTLQVTALETKALTIGLYLGKNMANVAPDPITGEVSIRKPARPSTLHYRVLALAVDETEAGEIYVARFFPRMRVTDYAEQAHQSNDDDPISYGITFTAFTDATLGYSQDDLFGGPGWAALTADMGF
ncbi:phage tail tube protein [Actinomadura litoris]|uniref:phage tail tube protein n=1 Tax=Actinomadura litoris TaxID=2678616 RepID=UPI001FA6B52D|nr:hypothetical protein [Actinomadura litoris]